MPSPFQRSLSRVAASAASVLVACIASFATAPVDAQANDRTTTAALRREILAMDARLSDAYDACKTRRLYDVFSRDAELFFAERGRLRGIAAHVDEVRRGDCAMRRETAASEHRIEALPGHTGAIDGAIQVGEQRFCARTSQSCDGMSTRFVAVWRRTERGWRIARLIRYAYAPAPR